VITAMGHGGVLREHAEQRGDEQEEAHPST